jgi:hypothetical protein
VIDRFSLSVLSMSVREDGEVDSLLANAFVWDYTDSEVLILTNYHTWNSEELFKYCFPPQPQHKKKVGRKRKKSENDDQDPVTIVLHNSDDDFEHKFVVTEALFKYIDETDDFAVLQLPKAGFTMKRIPVSLGVSTTLCIHAIGYVAHTGEFNVTGGEVSGLVPGGFTMNLLSAPGYSGAAIVADHIGQAIGYMGGNLNVSTEKNSQHQSYGYRFDKVLLTAKRKDSPSNSRQAKGRLAVLCRT